MATSAKAQPLQYIISQLRNDLEVIERKWDNYTEGRSPNSGRESFLNGIQGYYRLRPTAGRQTFCIGDIAMVHDTLHLHRRYNSRAAVAKILDIIIDLRLLRFNVERLLRTISNNNNTPAGREKLISLLNDTATWKEVISDKFSLVEMTAPSSPLFSRMLGDVLWRCINSAITIANFTLEATENQWPANMQLIWRKLASRELTASAALDAANNKPKGIDGQKSTLHMRGGRSEVDAKELGKLISRKQKLLKSMEAEQKRAQKPNFLDDDDENDDDDDIISDDLSPEIPDPVVTKVTQPKEETTSSKKGVKVRFGDETSVISTEGNVTVHIINRDHGDSRASTNPVQTLQAYPAITGPPSPFPQRATFIRSMKDEDSTKTKPYVDLIKDNDDNVVMIRRPQMEKHILLPSISQTRVSTEPRASTATLRPARVLLTEVPDKDEPSVSTKDLKNMIQKIEDIDGTVVDIHGDMRRELTRLRTTIRHRLRTVQQQMYDIDATVDRVANTML